MRRWTLFFAHRRSGKVTSPNYAKTPFLRPYRPDFSADRVFPLSALHGAPMVANSPICSTIILFFAIPDGAAVSLINPDAAGV